MAPHKSVLSLEQLSLRSLAPLVTRQALAMASASTTLFPVEDELELISESKLQKLAWQREQFLSLHVEVVREYLLGQVPFGLLDLALDKILEGLKAAILYKKRKWTAATNMTVFTREMYAVVKLSQLLVLPYRRHLDLDTIPKMIRTKLYAQLSSFTGLTTLILGSGSGGWVTEAYSTHFLIGLPYLKHLRRFSLKYDCTNSVLYVLADTCGANLVHVDIERSRQVNDDAVEAITKMNKLQLLNVFQTELTIDGVARILFSLRSSLRKLSRGDFLCDVVDYIFDEMESVPEPTANVLALEDFWASEEYYFHTQRQMERTATLCPRISTMFFMFNVDFCPCGHIVLANFEHLEDLDLWGGRFFTDGLAELLQISGFRLKKLSLVHVEEIDLRALALISHCCQNLTALGFHNCEFELVLDDNEDVVRPLHEEVGQPVAMLEVKVIKIVSMCGEFYVSRILRLCLNAEEIFIGMHTGISDKSLIATLSHNRLEHLRKFTVQKCEAVTLLGIQALIEACPCLTTLADIENFEAVTKEERQMLRFDAKINNLNLFLGNDENCSRIQDFELAELNFRKYALEGNVPSTDDAAEWRTD